MRGYRLDGGRAGSKLDFFVSSEDRHDEEGLGGIPFTLFGWLCCIHCLVKAFTVLSQVRGR